jgi:hypothetical protein
MKLNKEELVIGFILGLGFFWAIGWWCVPLALVTSLLWALGGYGLWGTKAWRRFGIPLVLMAIIRPFGIPTIVASVFTAVLLSIGYGSRSTQPFDPGSPLGNFWLDRVNDEDLSKWLSRATIILAVWLIWYIAI